jgi:membrane associated rhomboid family serine protease
MAFFQSGDSHEPAIRAPAVVLWLIALLAAVYAPRFFLSDQQWAGILFDFGFVPARYASDFLAARNLDPGTPLEQAAPFFSYMFLHASIGHLLINSLWLLAFGPVVARRFGPAFFLLFYFLCGVAAVLAHLVCNWESLGPVIGASGAISGLMAAAIRMLRLPGAFSFSGDAPLAPILSRPVVTFTLVWVVMNAVAGLIGFGPDSGPHLIAWQAHMGGYFAGLLLAGPFDRFAQRRGKAIA